MPNTPVCYYYQAGCCRNGNTCTFVHPKVRCRTFASDGWCPYGYNCHFWHDPSVKFPNVSFVKKPCQFFANNQCKYGDKCSFSHDINAENNGGITLEEYRATKKVKGLFTNIHAPESMTVALSNCEQNGSDPERDNLIISKSIVNPSSPNKTSYTSLSNEDIINSMRQPHQKSVSLKTLTFKTASKEEICNLNQLELIRIRKHFASDKLQDIGSSKDFNVFCVRFSSTDPDWVYDVREIVLNIIIPQMYPKEPLQVTVVLQEHLPIILVDHLNKAIASWIRCKHQYLERINRIELYLRPFLLWLDRNLEELFTEGLRKYKAFLEGGKLESDLSALLNEKITDVTSHCKSNNNDSSNNLPSSYDNSLTGLIPPVAFDSKVLDDLISIDLNSNPSKDTIPLSGSVKHIPTNLNSLVLNVKSVCNACNATKESESPNYSLSSCDSSIGSIPFVIPENEKIKENHSNHHGPHNGDQLTIESDDNDATSESNIYSQTDESVLESSSTDGNVDDSVNENENIQPSVDGEQEESYRDLHESSSLTGLGTQKLLMNGLRLFGKAGTYIQRRLSVSLHCTRCRLAFQWVFTFHGAQTVSNFNNHGATSTFLRSLPPYTTHCGRCHQRLGLLFQTNLAHAFDNNIGILHLDGCIADDVPPKQSSGIVWCTGCFSSVRVSGLNFDSPYTRRCFNCHSIIGLEFSKFQLELLKQPSNSHVMKTDNCNKNQPPSSEIPRRMRRILNSAQNVFIQDGSPLPAFGSCKHYRKSYRWLRFPCCGRLEPCDVCHDNSVVDEHEMELATRMVCGFCSKEQPFSATKPCVRCGKTLSGTHSSHWEGGKGCRNQVTMSRKDSRKYSQVNKVLSRKKTKSK
ncbi:hypothetical protein EWB00_009148 [Schistosoma japonicum]|uniref:Nucleoporin NUP42 n=2 Tax=Schistosoma japonicum TaxID=6182 RepID=A0A4Z2CN27_SCHJA|nr:hypothetical protein KSF78_0001627 [Schistosoma japonicum]KAH8854246.1 hypothetical protein KSF78_0001627 [Schistosoma japonicum]TNN05575.1 hypothetical protein EWB00_009148 [Schistosoma japonicum]TNN05576.1 hypothetical protein EWB00_009148 [Schistosoma japonicum]TNN05578.1 hypothetical protein EWB00_009148 [Schistosoma japonicum]